MKRRLLTILLVTAMLAMLLPGVSAARDVWSTKHVQVTRATATGALAIAKTLAPGVAFRLIEVRLHLSGASATSENFTVTVNSYAGANYDVQLFSEDLNTATHFVWVPDNVRYFHEDDELDFAWANSDTRTYGLEILYEPIL